MEKLKTVTLFESPESAQAELYAELSKLSPEERLVNFCILLKQAHGESLNIARRLDGTLQNIIVPRR